MTTGRYTLGGTLLAVLLASTTPIALVAAPSGAAAQAATVDFAIAPGSLDQVLARFGETTGLAVFYDADLTAGASSAGVSGNLSSQAALDRLLAGTDFGYRLLQNGAVTIERTEDAAASDGPIRLGAVTVTARRTEERLQDVPASVVVVSREELERSGFDDTRDVMQATPNVNFVGGGTPVTAEPVIRGFGNQIGIGATSPSVGVFVDGVIANPTTSLFGVGQSTLDLERVETVLGPQNNNFGRGTVGGAINFVTRKPTDEFELQVGGELGSRPDGRGTLILNQPLNENGSTAARLAFSGSASDGFVDIAGDGPDQIGNEDYNLRFSLRSRPVEELTLDGSFSFDRSQFDALGFATLESIGNGNPVFPGSSPGESTSDRLMIRGDAAYELDAGRLVFRVNYAESDLEGTTDTDFTALDIIETTNDTLNRSIGSEIRYEGNEFDLPRGLGGLALNLGTSIAFVDLEVDGVTDPGQAAFDLTAGGLPDDGSTIRGKTSQEVFSLGVFTEGRWRPIPRLELAAGVRFNLDDVSLTTETVSSGFSAVTVPSVPEQSGSDVFTAFTPNASIKYDWTEDLSTYFSYTSGFRAGGFSPILGRGFTTIDEENANQFEVGFRGNFLDDRLSLSASGFLLKVDGFQSESSIDVGGIPVFVDGNNDAESIGAELLVVARPIDDLTLSAGYGFLDAEFADGAVGPDGQDLEGSDLTLSPKHSVRLTADYVFPVDQLASDGFLRAEYYAQTNFAANDDPDSPRLDGFDVLNLRAGLRGDRFEFGVFVENVFDESYATGLSGPAALGNVTGAGRLGTAGPPRRFGVMAKWIF